MLSKPLSGRTEVNNKKVELELLIREPIFEVADLQERAKETEFETNIYIVAREQVTYMGR
jgi:hypothetical protein